MKNLAIIAALLAGAYLVYRIASKPAATKAASASTAPSDWVKAGSQQDQMLNAQTAGLL